MAPLHKLILSEEIMDRLSGRWTGSFPIEENAINVAFRFERTKEGVFIGCFDFMDQEAKGIPILEAGWSDGKLKLTIGTSGELTGQFSEEKIVGGLKQGPMVMPLSVEKR